MRKYECPWLVARNRKLSDEQKEMIRWLVRVNQHELARHFGVAWITIQRIQSPTKKYGYKGKKPRKRRKAGNTRKTAPGFAKVIEKKRQNQKWLRSIEQFREYHRRPDALYHAKLNSLKTHCKRRHPLTSDNVYVQIWKGRPRRRCLICFKQTQKERSAKIYQKRKTDSIRRRGIQAQKGVRQQQGCNLRDAQQDRFDEGQQNNGKGETPSQIQVISVSRREEEYAKEEL